MKPQFVRRSVLEMDGYAPGEQPAPGTRVIKLNTNENPYPPSPAVLEAVRSVDGESLRRYPQPLADTFRQTAAKVLPGVTPDMVIAGNGSDDILTIATRTFIPPGGTLAAPEPTYSLYPVLARLEDANYVGVKWADGYALPIDALSPYLLMEGIYPTAWIDASAGDRQIEYHPIDHLGDSQLEPGYYTYALELASDDWFAITLLQDPTPE